MFTFSLSVEEGLLGPTSDDDLPDFLLPDDSAKTRKLPGYLRTGSAPKIFKASLKDYHGLEGVHNLQRTLKALILIEKNK